MARGPRRAATDDRREQTKFGMLAAAVTDGGEGAVRRSIVADGDRTWKSS